MGAFNISIKGFGAHHNRNNVADANRIAQAFVQALKANGHDISMAEFQPTGGEAEDLRAVDYTAKYDDPPETGSDSSGESGKNPAVPATADVVAPLPATTGQAAPPAVDKPAPKLDAHEAPGN